ncbi:unnamed protein product [Brassicogethes aeneus]|uniref:Enkurin domain-containing protein n=1 Tax=Brassicogethes aeneus TaxID=1431903 RepID=A0A9P0FC37_BRAAE|nr:unnamed protein product [Brassicogethes aeneus]
MSLVIISNHNECIYDITRKQQERAKKAEEILGDGDKNLQLDIARRREKFNFNLRCEKRAHATMGVSEEIPPDPENFLKKGTGKQANSKCREIVKTPRCLLSSKRPPIPPVDVKKNNDTPKTNFITKNIKTVKEMKAKEPIHRVVVHSSGATKPLTYFVKGEEYGAVPNYLVKLKEEAEEKRLKAAEEVSFKQPLCRYITSDEREALLEGLKQNWEELQIAYQGLPILTDTIPKINKKVRLENDLKQLENDIVKVEKHPYLYVYRDEIEKEKQ